MSDVVTLSAIIGQSVDGLGGRADGFDAKSILEITTGDGIDQMSEIPCATSAVMKLGFQGSVEIALREIFRTGEVPVGDPVARGEDDFHEICGGWMV